MGGLRKAGGDKGMGKARIGTIYRYRTGKYVREKLGEKPKDTMGYRVVPVPGKPGRKVLVAIRRKKGPRGGRTKAVALLRHIRTAKGRQLARRAKIKRAQRRRRR
jgi:hypothetical protein